MSILGNDLLLGSGDEGYNLTRSLRFRRSAGGYLSRTAGAGNQQIMTLSFWFKRGQLGVAQYLFGSYANGSAYTNIYIESTDQIGLADAASGTNLLSTQVFRDPSAWYHIVVAIDTTQATAANRVKFYVNNVQITAFASSTYPAQNTNLNLNSACNHTLFNNAASGATNYTDGYQAETNFIGGQQLTPSSFGSTNALTGVWQPAKYGGTYGTNGFYLPFTDNSALTTSSNAGLGKDFSGNGNYWTTNNISITAGTTYDSMTDVPTLTSATAANFAVLNPLANKSGTLAGANLNYSSANTLNNCSGTIGMSSGKWYWETTFNLTDSTQYGAMGVTLNPSGSFVSGSWPGLQSYEYACNQFNGSKDNNGVNTAYGSSLLTAGDIMMCAVDMDNGKIWWGKNGTWFASGDPAAGTNAGYTGLSGTAFPQVGNQTTSANYNTDLSMNFGQRPFTYTPPTGYVALNTYNLPTSTIVKGNTVMDATLWTGNSTGSTTQTITNAGGFKPDFLWGKSRSAAYDHVLIDSVRGVTKLLYSDLSNAEVTNANALSSFNSNGFTVGTDAGGLNDNGKTFVGWQWQAGQGTTSSNTNGTITSTVSVNASAGFSVVTYTGTGANATVGHGLGVAPSFIIGKKRSSTGNWQCWQATLGGTQYISLNSTAGVNTSSTVFNGAPTSTVFNLGTDTDLNASGATNVAYCWSEIAGFSKFGSYTGNGSADGAFVYCGLLPRFLLIKRTDTTASWRIFDTARDPSNVEGYELYPNLSNAESSFAATLDGLSNGFKIRSSDVAYNASGGTYIFAAFASNPFKNSLAR